MVRIDQLAWGEATANKQAAILPVRFATSLLKDRNGVIKLDVPVEGTLDDPSLRIGPIIWQVITNIITKAVTAPFAVLGSLIEVLSALLIAKTGSVPLLSEPQAAPEGTFSMAKKQWRWPMPATTAGR